MLLTDKPLLLSAKADLVVATLAISSASPASPLLRMRGFAASNVQ